MSRSTRKTSSEIDRAIRQTSQLRKLILSLKEAKRESDRKKKKTEDKPGKNSKDS